MARGSALEVQTQLLIAQDLGSVSRENRAGSEIGRGDQQDALGRCRKSYNRRNLKPVTCNLSPAT
jgi:hypothetical protein